jgi:hypothetical protein
MLQLQYPLRMPEPTPRLMKPTTKMQMQNLIIQDANPLLPCPAFAPFCSFVFLYKLPQSTPFFASSDCAAPYSSAVSAAAFLFFPNLILKALFSIPLLAQFSSSRLSLTSASFGQESSKISSC